MTKCMQWLSFVLAMVGCAGIGCAGSTGDNDANGSPTPGVDGTIGTTDGETDTNSDLGKFDPGGTLPDCGGEDVACFRLVSLWGRTPHEGAVAIENARLVVTWISNNNNGKHHSQVAYDVPFTPSSNTFGVPLKAIAAPEAEQMICHRTCTQCACIGPSFAFGVVFVTIDANNNGKYDIGEGGPVQGFGVGLFVNSDAEYNPAPMGWNDSFPHGVVGGTHIYKGLGPSHGALAHDGAWQVFTDHTFDFLICRDTDKTDCPAGNGPIDVPK